MDVFSVTNSGKPLQETKGPSKPQPDSRIDKAHEHGERLWGSNVEAHKGAQEALRCLEPTMFKTKLESCSVNTRMYVLGP
jgi:hypothetical protein